MGRTLAEKIITRAAGRTSVRPDRIAGEPEAGAAHNVTRSESYSCEPVPPHRMDLVRAGGLVPCLERRLKAERATT